jgi:hypothetical protein
MTSQWVSAIVFIAGGLYGIVGAARTYLRRPPSAEEFGKLFLRGWISAGMLAVGTLSCLQLLTFEPTSFYFLFIIAGLFAYVAAGSFAISAAIRRYQRAMINPDFAEDAGGNPVFAAPPEEAGDDTINTWEDLIRAQRTRRA